ncbi:MAG: hypothetical protein WC803_11490 [Sphingomonas sp.]
MVKVVMRAALAFAALVAAGAVLPAAAQDAPIGGVTYIYGERAKCPTDQSGNEITVCVRRPASEQFRIPKELREGSIKPEYESFVVKQQAASELLHSGIGSCSATGAGGQIGCSAAEFEAYRRAKRAKAAEKKAEAVLIDR